MNAPKFITKILFLGLITTIPVIQAQVRPPKTPQVVRQPVADTVDLVKGSIVQITARITFDPSKPPFRRVLGTGFIVSREGHVITANHVVKELDVLRTGPDGKPLVGADGKLVIDKLSLTAQMMRIGTAIPAINTQQVRLENGFNLHEFEIIDRDERNDVALLKFRTNPFIPRVVRGIVTENRVYDTSSKVSCASLNKAKPRDGEQVIISGFPEVAKTFITTVGYIASTTEHDIQEVMIPSPFSQVPGSKLVGKINLVF